MPYMNSVHSDFEETPTIGGFMFKTNANTFDDVYNEACENVSTSLNMRMDPGEFVKSPEIQQQFKEDILSGFYSESQEDSEKGALTGNLYNELSQLYDNTVEDLIKESSVGQLLPIKSIDLPLVIRQHAKCSSKLIIDTEITPSPVVKKQIERTYVIDKETGKEWQYPQCFFNDDYKEIFKAGKGLELDTKKVDLPLFNYDIIANLTTAAIPKREKITIDIQITSVYLEDGTEVVLDRPIRTNLADGAWIGGIIKDRTVKKADDTKVVLNDVLSGFVDWTTNTCTLTSASGQITGVSFKGFLSNENNERAVTWDYRREDLEWKVEDGFRTDVPYSLEYLEDSKALLKEDMYQKTYSNITEILVQMEDSQVLEYLDEIFQRYDGVVLDPLDFNPFISKRRFDCDSTIATVALPSEYIQNQLKFEIDRFIIDIADNAKLEDLAFVIYGNPRYISLLDPNVNWVVKQGDVIGGVKLNYNYGVMTSGNTKVMVVSSMKINASKMQGLRIIPYPISKNNITFKHYKYSTHIMTAANSAYRDSKLPGGSATYIMGTSRYTNAHVQGIEGEMAFDNADFIKTNLLGD